MNFHITLHLDPATERKLDDISTALKSMETLIMKTLADLQNDVAADTTAEQSAITLLGGLSAQIAALKTTQTDPNTAAAIDALATEVETNTSTLAAAVTANTAPAGQ